MTGACRGYFVKHLFNEREVMFSHMLQTGLLKMTWFRIDTLDRALTFSLPEERIAETGVVEIKYSQRSRDCRKAFSMGFS